ncbi:hypothetical protein [Oceanobacillus bengalensis]|uniref:Uncharacterized protein n=1 Tax=Oceanobacillus bengalensis TaxID=1435466 RepID=A0A494YVG2_9BACI|nr:hypothetical protein [Oceanobacillus bengalensis]RKQ14123.1 hypothetical protein D8M05_13915 [Oceanobacillus bengalensis]
MSEKEELLLQAVKTQHAILKLLENTMHETYKFQKGLPREEQNSELMNVAERARTIIAKKPRLKEMYRELEEEYGVELD